MSTLSSRMKAYEQVHDVVMTRRVPVVIRIDGNSFSKWTKAMKMAKPVDERMTSAMEAATWAVFKYCSGAVFGYTQSDEITLVLRNDLRFDTDPMLANRIQKVTSLLASVATSAFNRWWYIHDETDLVDLRPAQFDARVFTVPDRWEALNALVWRQQDAWRNCVSSFSYYEIAKAIGGKGKARKLLHGKNINEQQELLWSLAGVNVNDIPTHIKRGTAVYTTPEKEYEEYPDSETGERRHRKTCGVITDREMPVLTADPDFFMKLWKPREGEPDYEPKRV